MTTKVRTTPWSLAEVTHLNESETHSGMQTRVISLVGSARSLLCFVGTHTAASILLHVKKENTFYLRPYYYLA